MSKNMTMEEAQEFKGLVNKHTNEVVTDDSLSKTTFIHSNRGFVLNRMNVWSATLYDIFTPEDSAEEAITAVKDEVSFSLEPRDSVCCRIMHDIFESRQVVLPELAVEAFRNDILNEAIPSVNAHFSQPVVAYSIDNHTASVFFSVSGFDEEHDRYFLSNFVIVCNRQQV